jgi:hypothetical protein
MGFKSFDQYIDFFISQPLPQNNFVNKRASSQVLRLS